jgi:hypothetical protein
MNLAEIAAYKWSVAAARRLNFRVQYYQDKLNYYKRLIGN